MFKPSFVQRQSKFIYINYLQDIPKLLFPKYGLQEREIKASWNQVHVPNTSSHKVGFLTN